MDLLGDPLTICPLQTDSEFTIKLYPSGLFKMIDDPHSQIGDFLVWIRAWTQSDDPKPLLSLGPAL